MSGRAGGGTGPRGLGESLDRLARRLGAPRADALVMVFAHWPDIVGDGVAEHCRPLALANGVLVVGVDDGAWATQLRFLADEVLTRLAGLAGEGVAGRLEVRVRRAPGPR